MLPPLLHPLIIRVLNALLARESWACERLRPHAGKALRLELGGFDLTLEIAPGGTLQPHTGGAPAVTVRVAGGDIPHLLAADPQQRMQAVRIEGEAALAHVASDLARDLRWDIEDELATWIGDIPAGILLRGVRGASGTLRASGSRLAENTVEYVVHEAHLLVTRAQLDERRADLQRLDADIDALAERISALERASRR